MKGSPKDIDVIIFSQMDHITFKKSEEQAGHLCKRSIAKIFFYMAKTLEDTNIMRRAVWGRRLTYGSEAELRQQ